MKKLCLLILSALLSVVANAQDAGTSSSPFDNLSSNRLVLGYVNEEVEGEKEWYWGNPPNDGSGVKLAITFPAERMQRIKGNQITHIRLKMVHTDVSNMKVWIGTAKDKQDILIQDVKDLREGWTEVALTSPYTITGDCIFVGIIFYNDHYTCFPITFYRDAGKDAGSWYMYSNGYEEKEGLVKDSWFESYRGTWYIQCLVEGESIPQNDIHIVESEGSRYKKAIKAGEGYDCTLTVRNWGTTPIENSEFQVLSDGMELGCLTAGHETIDRGGLQKIELRITSDEGTSVGRYPLTIRPKTLNGEEYMYPEAYQGQVMKVYQHDIGRQNVFVQLYTGTWCPYCPGLESIIENKREEFNLVYIACHDDEHFSNQVTGAYDGIRRTTAYPDADFNRCVSEYSDWGKLYFSDWFDEIRNQPSFANVSIAGSYDDNSRHLNVIVSGERNEDFVPVEGWTNLTVLLVEDHVLGYQNGSDLSPYYPHNGIVRANLSEIWGDLVEWNGDKYEMHYSANVNSGWNAENMRIVAFLGKPFTGKNYDEIGIVNCDEQALKSISAGIHDISMGQTADEIYDLNGRKLRSSSSSLKELPKGIYIVGGKKVIR